MDGERDEARREGPPPRPHKKDFSLSSSTKIRAYTLKLFYSHSKIITTGRELHSWNFFILKERKGWVDVLTGL